MILSISSMIKKADREGFALGAFNTSDLETTQAICEVANELKSPVIVATSPKTIEYAGLEQIFDLVIDEIKEQRIQAVIHLDHGKDWGIIKRSIDIGYPSVMIDGSSLDYSSNVNITRKVVEYARKQNVFVEGEIGVISRQNKGELSRTSVYTDVKIAEKFAKDTGVDILAVSVGNEHGAPRGEKLDLNLLSEIANAVSVPLVMHGASGLSYKDIEEAIGLGVVKINIDTKIKKAFSEEMRDSSQLENDPREILKKAKESAKKVIREYINIFGSAGKS